MGLTVRVEEDDLRSRSGLKFKDRKLGEHIGESCEGRDRSGIQWSSVCSADMDLRGKMRFYYNRIILWQS